MVADICDAVKRETEELSNLVDLGDAEAGSAAELKRRRQVREQFLEYINTRKKTQQLHDKFGETAASNKKLKRRARWKAVRSRLGEVTR